MNDATTSIHLVHLGEMATGPYQAGRGDSLEAQGNILDHEYQITRDGIPVVNISKLRRRSVARCGGCDRGPLMSGG
jgi:hypothetical protein